MILLLPFRSLVNERCLLEFIENQLSKDAKSILLTADLGFGMFDNIIQSYSRQFINVGVAEQLMTSVSAGLSLRGFFPISYSIGPFPTLRCLEQIRNDLCYHECNALIVTTGSGFSYGQLGFSHHCTDDLILRTLPSLTVISPASSYEARTILGSDLTQSGVSYLRLDKSHTNLVPIGDYSNVDYPIFKYHSPCTNVLALAHGSIVDLYLQALSLCKHSFAVATFPKLRLTDTLVSFLTSFDHIIIVEEHYKQCGFSSLFLKLLLLTSLILLSILLLWENPS